MRTKPDLKSVDEKTFDLFIENLGEDIESHSKELTVSDGDKVLKYRMTVYFDRETEEILASARYTEEVLSRSGNRVEYEPKFEIKKGITDDGE